LKPFLSRLRAKPGLTQNKASGYDQKKMRILEHKSIETQIAAPS
jgi:hypothetical protein